LAIMTPPGRSWGDTENKGRKDWRGTFLVRMRSGGGGSLYSPDQKNLGPVRHVLKRGGVGTRKSSLPGALKKFLPKREERAEELVGES